MSLKTDYKDAIPPSTGRVYRPTYNTTDGTMTLEDVTEYEQVGDSFGAADINVTNTKVNDLGSAQAWKSIAVPTPSVSGNVRTYTFDMAGKNENEIGLRIFANGYAPIDLRVLPAPYAGAYIVSYQDANLTSRTIVNVSVSGETLTISVDSVYLSTSGAYSVIGMFLWR